MFPLSLLPIMLEYVCATYKQIFFKLKGFYHERVFICRHCSFKNVIVDPGNTSKSLFRSLLVTLNRRTEQRRVLMSKMGGRRNRTRDFSIMSWLCKQTTGVQLQLQESLFCQFKHVSNNQPSCLLFHENSKVF